MRSYRSTDLDLGLLDLGWCCALLVGFLESLGTVRLRRSDKALGVNE